MPHDDGFISELKKNYLGVPRRILLLGFLNRLGPTKINFQVKKMKNAKYINIIYYIKKKYYFLTIHLKIGHQHILKKITEMQQQ